MSPLILSLLTLTIATVNGISEDCSWILHASSSGAPKAIKNQWYTCIFREIENKTAEAFKSTNNAVLSGLSYDALTRRSNWSPLKLPPGSGRGNKAVVKISKVELRHLYPKESDNIMDVEGYMHMTWKDSRFTWSQSRYSLDKIYPSDTDLGSRMWRPIFEFAEPKNRGAVQASEIIKPVIKSDGSINASVYMDWQSDCTFSMSHLWTDTADCVAVLKKAWDADGNMVDVEVEDGEVGEYAGFVQKLNWRLVEGTVSTMVEGDDTLLKISIKAERANGISTIEMLLPILFATILVIVAPMFGHFKWQALIKVVAFVLQYLAVLIFLTANWSIKFVQGKPKIVRFFEFAMSVTLLNLIITLALWYISRNPPRLPPPSFVSSLFDCLSKIPCMGAPTEPRPTHSENGAVENGDVQSNKPGSSGATGWFRFAYGMNNLVSLAFLAIYVMGIFALLI